VYEDFVIRANIKRFRHLLATGLDDDTRASVAALLICETMKLRPVSIPPASQDLDVSGEL
jgi:hypothetical protein